MYVTRLAILNLIKQNLGAIDNCVEIVDKLKPYLHVEDAVHYERYHEL